MKRILFLSLAVAALAALALLILPDPDRGSRPAATPASRALAEAPETLPDAPTAERAPATRTDDAPPADPRELLERLRELAALDLFDEDEASAAMRSLLLDPREVRRALRLLVSGALKEHPDLLSPAEVGAIRLVWTGVATYNDSVLADELAAAGFHVDGRAFTEEVLRALASIEEPAASALARMLAGLAVDGARVVDASYLELLRVLIATYPDREALYALFLAQIGLGEAGDFDLAGLDPREDPALLAARLVAAFREADAARALQVLQWIEGAYAEADPAARLALAGAVASGAPPELAAEFLSQRASSTMLGAFDTLGARAGGLAALEREYNTMLATGGDATARRMIVSGLAGGGTDVLVGIARTDPDPDVRGQAMVTASATSEFVASSSFLQELRAAHEASGGSPGTPGYATITTAHNLLVQADGAGDAALAADTVAFLRELALDAALSPHDRARIPEILKDRLPAQEWESLAASVQAAGST